MSAKELFQLFDQEFAPTKLRGRAKQTRHNYRATLTLFAEFLGRLPTTDDLTDATVCRFLDWYFDRPNVRSARSANNRRDYLLAFWRWCCRKRHVLEWPDIEKLPEPDIQPDSWAADELWNILKACQDEDLPVGKQPACVYWPAIHHWWYDTGERTGATLLFEWEHLDPQAGVVALPGTIRKGNKSMVYELKPKTRELLALMRQIDPRATRVFGEFPFTLSNWYKRYERILVRAGVPSGRRNKPQKMRRTFATDLEFKGGNATEAFDHTDRRVTKKSYLNDRVLRPPSPNRFLDDLPGPDRAA